MVAVISINKSRLITNSILFKFGKNIDKKGF